MPTSTRKVGDINQNGQVLIEKTSLRGNDHLQYIWVLECTRSGSIASECRYRYGANGSDFHHRLCPKCQNGAKGLSYSK